MRNTSFIILISLGFSVFFNGCTEALNNNTKTTTDLSQSKKIKAPTASSADSMMDPRDGETYPTVVIWTQTWMAENLRYNAPGSLFNPEYPSTKYGRLYDGTSAQTACPSGWHLPTDLEWSNMEMALGMPLSDAAKTSWRGAHGTKLKSTEGWGEDNTQNGTNSSGFNGLASGFYFDDEFGGLKQSSGFWTGAEGGKLWVRFLGAPLEGVNRFEDKPKNWGPCLSMCAGLNNIRIACISDPQAGIQFSIFHLN